MTHSLGPRALAGLAPHLALMDGGLPPIDQEGTETEETLGQRMRHAARPAMHPHGSRRIG
jgi:hypothetical protein